MIELSTRPYSSSEKEKHLRKIPSMRSLFEGGILVFSIILALLVISIRLLDKWININSDLMFFLVFGAVVLAGVMTLRFFKPFEKAKKYRQMQDQAERGYVEVTYIKASKALKMEGARGIPIGFYLEFGHNENVQTQYLSGTYLNDPDDDQKFPNTEFEICRDSISGDVIDIHLHGIYFQPERISLTGSDVAGTKNHIDGQLVNNSIDEIKAMLGL